MKKIILLVQMLCILGCLNSCIQDEPLNAECDIVAVDAGWIESHKSILIGNPIVTNDHVSFIVKEDCNLSQLDPLFTLTDGAHMTMEVDGKEVEGNGAVRDFTSPKTYKVYSQDGNWSKSYTVSFSSREYIKTCSFEHYELDNSQRYHVWYEVSYSDSLNPRRDYWASGNGGYALTGMGRDVSFFPTVSEQLGVQGNGVKLQTRSTGSFGLFAGMPIAAGNLFIGEFDTKIAMSAPRMATHFGLQLVGGKPVELCGYYKYTAGAKFTDEKNTVHPEMKDTADIYAVLYEVDPTNFVALNGDDVLSSERIVMMARIDDPGEPQEWKYFAEPFKMRPGKTFEEERLRNDGYAIAIVATSSRQGAYFKGAVGSVLYIDELKVVWEGDEETTPNK